MLLLALGLLLGAPPDTTLQLVFSPEIGGTQLIALEKVREEFRGQGDDAVLVERVAHEWTIVAAVERERMDGYDLRWHYFPGPKPPPDASWPRTGPRIEPVTGTFFGEPVRFSTDARGQPRAVVAPAETRQAVLRAIEYARPRTDPSDRQRLDMLARQVQTDSGLRALLLPDVERFHLLLGRTLSLGRPVEKQAEVRNPFGDGSIPAVESIRVDSLAADGNIAYVTWSLTPDAAVLAQIVLDLIEGFSPGAVRDRPEELAARFKVREEARFEIDPRRGLVHAAEYVRRIETAEHARSEITRFRLLKADSDS